MFAIDIRQPGPTYQLALSEIAIPRPGPHEILINTAAAGVNRADLLQARGKYPPPPGAPATLGMEVSGLVVRGGDATTRFRPGDLVCALMAGGGYAEYALADEGSALPIPNGVEVIRAAGLPEALFTVWTNLYETAQLKPGESVLIHGGASGIGTMAIQLCVALGSTVFATAGSAQKCAACIDLGATSAIDYRSRDFVESVLVATERRGVDVILDMVGGDYIARNFTVAAQGGRIVNIAFQKGTTATVDFAPMIGKRLTLAATTLRGRTTTEKTAIAAALLQNVWPLIEAGKIRPVIDSIFPFAEAQAAHARMASGAHIGKILLANQSVGS